MTHGMVVAPQPEAVEAGAVVLMNGGNAIDAAIACALVQGVVDPCMTGIAGFGSMHVLLPEQGVHQLLDFHTRAPAAVREDMWSDRIRGEARDGFGFFLEGRVNEVGYQSIMVPGNLKGYYQAVSRYGRQSWSDVVAPAIAEARDGFVIRPHVHEFWTRRDMGRVTTREKLAFTAAGRQLFFDSDGELLRVGDRLQNPQMAESLQRIADGGEAVFYRGDMARQMVDDIQANDGLLSLDDLAAYDTRSTPPLWTEYRGYRIASNPPPGGGIMVLQMLNILEHFDLRALGHNTPEYIRVVSEAMKYATIDKDTRVGDPEFVPVPIDEILSRDYAGELAARIRRGEQAHVERLDNQASESRDTTHVCVADEHGNIVSMTHSLGMPSGVITDGLGFMYNGCMSVFDPRPGRVGSLAPGKSRFTAMSPTVVFDGEQPCLAIGAPGGTWITMGVLQGILNVLDFEMSVSDAVAAPRFTANSDIIDVSNRIPRFVTAKLQQLGYPVARSHLSYTFAGVHAIAIRDGVCTGGADPGRDGMALSV